MLRPLVFSIPSYSGLAAKILDLCSFSRGDLEYRHFPDGERYLRLKSEVRGRAAVLVGGSVDDVATLDLYDIACGLVSEGCRRLQVVIPFYGHSTMERATRPGEIVTAKTRARLFSSIPRASEGNQFLFLDLHSEGIPFYFEGSAQTVHLSGQSLISRAARQLANPATGTDLNSPDSNTAEMPFVLACVDAGRAKWVQSLANSLGVKASFVFKRRLSGDETEITAVNADVQGQKVIIYDDMIRTGGSLLKAAQAYKEAGAVEIHALTTHGVFTDGALEKLRRQGLIQTVVCTDSHPRAAASGPSSFVKVISCAEIFADHFNRVF